MQSNHSFRNVFRMGVAEIRSLTIKASEKREFMKNIIGFLWMELIFQGIFHILGVSETEETV
jgi:hypothetical protein